MVEDNRLEQRRQVVDMCLLEVYQLLSDTSVLSVMEKNSAINVIKRGESYFIEFSQAVAQYEADEGADASAFQHDRGDGTTRIIGSLSLCLGEQGKMIAEFYPLMQDPKAVLTAEMLYPACFQGRNIETVETIVSWLKIAIEVTHRAQKCLK